MELKKSTKIAFAYTIKLIRRGYTATKADYNVFFNKLAKFAIPVEYKVSEIDKEGRVHYHGILYLEKGFYRKRICVPGYHIKLEEVYNKKGWEKYIHKDCSFINMPKSPDSPEFKIPKFSLFKI